MKTTILFVSLLNGVGNLGWSILPSDVTARRRFATWSGQKPSGPMSEELNLGGGCTRGNERTDGSGFSSPSRSPRKSRREMARLGKRFCRRRKGFHHFHQDEEEMLGMILPQSLDLVLAVLVLRALLMRDSPNRTLHVVPTLFSPAQKAIDFFVVRRRQSPSARRRTRTATADPFLPFDCPLTD